jgi:glutathionylspermidine synthase
VKTFRPTLHERFAEPLLASLDRGMVWIEPIWRMVWSNKALLPVLSELFPDHPNLLPAFFREPSNGSSFVKKPKLSREGANVTVVESGVTVLATSGDYGEEGFIYQALAPIAGPATHNKCPVIGAWVIDGQPAGMGIRESDAIVTDNLSRFVPHRID